MLLLMKNWVLIWKWNAYWLAIWSHDRSKKNHNEKIQPRKSVKLTRETRQTDLLHRGYWEGSVLAYVSQYILADLVFSRRVSQGETFAKVQRVRLHPSIFIRFSQNYVHEDKKCLLSAWFHNSCDNFTNSTYFGLISFFCMSL